MPRRDIPDLDMTLDGRFIGRPRRLSIPMRIALGAALVAIVAGAIAFAALALWVATALIPVALAAAVIAWLAFRFQLWRARRSAGRQVWQYRSGRP